MANYIKPRRFFGRTADLSRRLNGGLIHYFAACLFAEDFVIVTSIFCLLIICGSSTKLTDARKEQKRLSAKLNKVCKNKERFLVMIGQITELHPFFSFNIEHFAVQIKLTSSKIQNTNSTKIPPSLRAIFPRLDSFRFGSFRISRPHSISRTSDDPGNEWQ